jgi:hypothetical protein
MKHTLALLFLIVFAETTAQKQVLTKGILLTQLRKTHTEKDWFVPLSIALQDVTAEQATWKDESGNHSIAELTAHLIFWNERNLMRMKGEIVSDFDGSNDDTFEAARQGDWNIMVKRLDQILREMENVIENAGEEKPRDWYDRIALISTHNAYHAGQIVFVRKLQRSWDSSKGVR